MSTYAAYTLTRSTEVPVSISHPSIHHLLSPLLLINQLGNCIFSVGLILIITPPGFVVCPLPVVAIPTLWPTDIKYPVNQ